MACPWRRQIKTHIFRYHGCMTQLFPKIFQGPERLQLTRVPKRFLRIEFQGPWLQAALPHTLLIPLDGHLDVSTTIPYLQDRQLSTLVININRWSRQMSSRKSLGSSMGHCIDHPRYSPVVVWVVRVIFCLHLGHQVLSIVVTLVIL